MNAAAENPVIAPDLIYVDGSPVADVDLAAVEKDQRVDQQEELEEEPGLRPAGSVEWSALLDLLGLLRGQDKGPLAENWLGILFDTFCYYFSLYQYSLFWCITIGYVCWLRRYL